MKALTNILSHLLMLLMLFIVACTEETAEVDNLMRQEQYVTVRMNIPGMTATATRAADGVIESITALAFDDADKLLEIETITTVTNTNSNGGFNGTFNLTVPNGTTTIHFLANLPDDYNLTNDYKLTDVKKESDLTKLSIGDWQTLRYWGMATYDGSNSTLSTTLYRNLAKISIKPSETDPEFNQFTQDQLKMTGFYMPNERGALIPNNNGAFDFDMNSNYCTIPQDVSSDNYQLWDFTSMYAFEHENTDSNPTYIICKIGDYHYKVALADNEGNRYPIIRNHEYIIYVSDVDDYSHDDNYRADTYDKAFDKLPINLDVQQEVIKTVELGISAATQALNYNDTSTEQVTVTVTVPAGVQQLTLEAPGFTIESGDAKMTKVSYGVYDIVDATNQQDNQQDVHFTLTLSSDAQDTYTISVEGVGGELVEVTGAETTISTSQGSATEGQTIWWQGAMLLDAADDATKLIFPYSYFTDTSSDDYLPVGSSIRFDYTNVGDGSWIQTANPKTWSQIGEFENGNNFVVLPITSENLATINEFHGQAWNVDAAFVLQGAGRVLNQITLIPAVRAITAGTPTPTSLYYNSSTEQTVEVSVTIPSGVTALNIKADDFSSVKQGDTSLEKSNDDVYVYTRAAEKVATEETIPFVLTLDRDKFSQQQYTSTDIIFSDGSSVEENAKATQDQVSVSLKPVPVVSFQYDANNTTLYWSNGNPTSLQVNMINVPSSVTLRIDADEFTVKQNNTELPKDGEGNYTYTGGNTTFTFIPTSFGEGKTINITGEGENVTVEETNIIVTVEETAAESGMSATSGTIDLGSATSTTLTLTKPASVTGVNVSITDANGASANRYFSITFNGWTTTPDGNGNFQIIDTSWETLELEFKVTDNTIPLGEYSITFTNAYGNQVYSTTAKIKLIYTLWSGEQTLSWHPLIEISKYNQTNHAGKTISFDLFISSDQHREIQMTKADGTRFITYSSNNTEDNEAENQYSISVSNQDLTINVTIPEGIDGLKVKGAGITLKKVYLTE